MVDNEDHCVLHNASVLEHMGNHQWPFQFSKNLFPDIFPDQGSTDCQVAPAPRASIVGRPKRRPVNVWFYCEVWVG